MQHYREKNVLLAMGDRLRNATSVHPTGEGYQILHEMDLFFEHVSGTPTGHPDGTRELQGYRALLHYHRSLSQDALGLGDSVL